VLLLKELLENAIDSGATCIDVPVSKNTVDKLEVGDDGHGIAMRFVGLPERVFWKSSTKSTRSWYAWIINCSKRLGLPWPPSPHEQA
jgi:hypothetical protein